MLKQTLTIEKCSDGILWGRVEYQDDLLVDSAKSIEALEKKFKKLLHDFHDVNPAKVKFEVAYDLTSVFQENEFLNISAIASRAGINPTLMRQYASGNKQPSPEKVKQIEGVLHGLANSLSMVRLTTPAKSRPKKAAKKAV